jgi:transposase
VVATTEGLPCAIEAFPGNTSDPKSFEATVDVVQNRFGLERVCVVGDRGMITSARVEALAPMAASTGSLPCGRPRSRSS